MLAEVDTSHSLWGVFPSNGFQKQCKDGDKMESLLSVGGSTTTAANGTQDTHGQCFSVMRRTEQTFTVLGILATDFFHNTGGWVGMFFRHCNQTRVQWWAGEWTSRLPTFNTGEHLWAQTGVTSQPPPPTKLESSWKTKSEWVSGQELEFTVNNFREKI